MLKQVTFTGADATTHIPGMLALSAQFPWIEWGILLPFGDGSDRFPTYEWVQGFIGAVCLAPHEVKTAAHICPPWTQSFLLNPLAIDALIGSAFDRVQINTHAHPYNFISRWQDSVVRDFPREYILQLDGVNEENLYGSPGNVTGLHDLSHGAGILPGSWPKPHPGRNQWVGYAGGLGPHNLAEQIPRILEVAGSTDIWIDMETHVRTNGWFDLKKVRDCIRIAEKYIGC